MYDRAVRTVGRTIEFLFEWCCVGALLLFALVVLLLDRLVRLKRGVA